MNMSTNVSQNILDSDNPENNTPLLKPKKILNNFVEKSRERANNLLNKFKEELLNLFDKYRDNVNDTNKGVKKITNWYNNLKDNFSDIFNNIQGKVTQAYNPTTKFKLDKKALNVTKRYKMDLKKFKLSLYDPISLLRKIKPLVLEKLKQNPSTKQQITLECLMKKTNPATGETTIDKTHFHSYYEEIFSGSNFDEIYEKMLQKIILSFETFLQNSSLWKFEKSLKVILNINEIRRLQALCYIPLPKFLQDKKAIINPQNEDQKCLLWCVAINELLKTTPDLKHPERITKILKKKADNFNVKDV